VNIDSNVCGDKYALNINLIGDKILETIFNLSFLAAGGKEVKCAELQIDDLFERTQQLFLFCAFIQASTIMYARWKWWRILEIVAKRAVAVGCDLPS
jgi:hypothetical protein